MPVGLDDLIGGRVVESARCDFKKTWSSPIRDSVVRTVCAFANDLKGLNGGYIVIGIDEHQGKPVLPPHGLEDLDLERIQKEIRGGCRRIEPEYQPVMSPEIFQNRSILVVWAPHGDVRPYQAPEDKKGKRNYYVQLGAETVAARGEVLNELMRLTAKVPFEDRQRADIPLTAISAEIVGQFLEDIHSEHARYAVEDLPGVLRDLRLTAKTNGTEAPRNIALIFFSLNPERYFPGACVELAQFRDDAGGDLIESRIFKGPMQRQIRETLDFLQSLFGEVTRKVPGQAEAERYRIWWNWQSCTRDPRNTKRPTIFSRLSRTTFRTTQRRCMSTPRPRCA